MYERRTPDPPPPRAPLGTRAEERPPSDVWVGDIVYLDGIYLRVRGMRSAGTADQRVLIFDGHPPWVMKKPTTTYRRPTELI